MKTILKTHSRATIAKTCGVSYRTVINWNQKNTMPLWAIEKLGFSIYTEPEPLTLEQAQDIFKQISHVPPALIKA